MVQEQGTNVILAKLNNGLQCYFLENEAQGEINSTLISAMSATILFKIFCRFVFNLQAKVNMNITILPFTLCGCEIGFSPPGNTTD